MRPAKGKSQGPESKFVLKESLLRVIKAYWTKTYFKLTFKCLRLICKSIYLC